MDLKSDDSRTQQYVTNVGLITSTGPHGHNVMSCEWTHYVSYAPCMMAVCVKPDEASHKNISETGEFGINLASVSQNIFSSVAGGNTGAKVDKIAVLKELGYEFYEAETIKPLMVKNSAMQAECKVVKQMDLGDHTMFVGEVQKLTGDSDIEPLVYHGGHYWHVGEKIEKPPEAKLEEIENLVDKHKRD